MSRFSFSPRVQACDSSIVRLGHSPFTQHVTAALTTSSKEKAFEAVRENLANQLSGSQFNMGTETSNWLIRYHFFLAAQA